MRPTLSTSVRATARGRSSPRRRPASRTIAPIGAIAGMVAALALGGVILLEVATWDKITPGTSGLGTPLGGSSQTEAAARLTPQVNALLSRPLQIRADGHTWNTSAANLGLKLDAAELAAAAYTVGRAGNPLARLGDQIAALVVGRNVAAASASDQAALDGSLRRLARDVDRPARDAELVLATDGTPRLAHAQNGVAVDVAASRERITRALADGSAGVELVTRSTPPAVADEAVQAARDQLDRLLGSDQPFTLTAGEQVLASLERPDIVGLLAVKPATAGQAAAVTVDQTPLRALAHKIGKDVDQDVQDARFAFKGGSLTPLRPSQEGRQLDEAATVAGITAKLLGGERSFELPITVSQPAVSSDDAQRLGIVERIDTGSTSFAGGIAEKKWNIKLAAQRLNGVVVPPGGTFSFNKEVGPTTLEDGFKWGYGITGGDGGVHTVPSVAGGICQVATTLFQPVFWSGYQLEERLGHLYWIPAYTSRGVVGLDVTVDPDSGVDFKWVNPTSDYVLIQSDSDDANVYFSLYGKKPTWQVQVEPAEISNRVPPDTRPTAEAEPTLPLGKTLQVESAREGFDVAVKRHVVPADGGKARELLVHTRYEPARTVTLVGTGGKPATAQVAAIIDRITNPAKAAARPATGPTPQASAPAKPTAQPSAQPSALPRSAASQPRPAGAATPTPS